MPDPAVRKSAGIFKQYFDITKGVGTMEIKGLGGVISAYKTTKANAPKKTSAAVSAKSNTDRVEFGFAAAITAAKAEIANEVNANAAPKEILEAGKSAGEFSADELAAIIVMG